MLNSRLRALQGGPGCDQHERDAGAAALGSPAPTRGVTLDRRMGSDQRL